MFPAGLEPATFRVWGGRDNHYTTETSYNWPGTSSVVFQSGSVSFFFFDQEDRNKIEDAMKHISYGNGPVSNSPWLLIKRTENAFIQG